MQKFGFALFAMALAMPGMGGDNLGVAFAQDTQQQGNISGACVQPDSVAVVGNSRIDANTVRASLGYTDGASLSFRDLQRAIKALYATGQFDDVQISCSVKAGAERGTLVIQVKERPVLSSYRILGIDRLPSKDVKERLDLPTGSPVDPQKIADDIRRVDSLYESKGYYLVRVRVDSALGADGKLALTFNIDEGHRLAISGIRITGNNQVSDKSIIRGMKSRPEGFFFWHKGEFKDDNYAQDLTENIPKVYGSRGYIDFRILDDTVIVDRNLGKGLIDLDLTEGPRYKVGSFEILGNRRFSNAELEKFYPFTNASEGPSFVERTTSLFRRRHVNPAGTFDKARWDEAQQKISEAYANEGYISAQVRPVLERVPGEDSVRVVNLRWEIEEGAPALVNRIEITGNDYTHESCIRDAISLAPGGVFQRAALIRSYQSIGNLNLFESPMATPEVRPSGDKGDVDIIFNVKEKRTGNINFGASMGQGTGLGGFIGLDQPNLLGRCKRAQVQWQFGRYINDFNLTYTDPSIKQSRISGSVTAYHTRSRFRLADLGQTTRSGGQLQFGFPIPNSYFSRLYVSYGGEQVKYGGGALVADVNCNNCFRSTLGLTFTRDARFGLPFASQGSMQTINAQFNGGPLGGTSSFQRYTTETRAYTPLGYIGGNVLGKEPMTFVAGLSTRSGFLFGNPGPFFYSQAFSMGGTQYGETLRGYEEFSITPVSAVTPNGFDPTAGESSARRSSFGNAFFGATAELGLRINQSMYVNVFTEGGRVWGHPREFDPTRLFRSVGFGAAAMSPLGPIGLDFGYGLDKTDINGNPDPGWKVHFKLGQMF